MLRHAVRQRISRTKAPPAGLSFQPRSHLRPRRFIAAAVSRGLVELSQKSGGLRLQCGVKRKLQTGLAMRHGRAWTMPVEEARTFLQQLQEKIAPRISSVGAEKPGLKSKNLPDGTGAHRPLLIWHYLAGVPACRMAVRSPDGCTQSSSRPDRERRRAAAVPGEIPCSTLPVRPGCGTARRDSCAGGQSAIVQFPSGYDQVPEIGRLP